MKARVARFILSLLGGLPLAVLQSLGRAIGTVAYILRVRMRKVTGINLALCFPELNKSERNSLTLKSMQATAQVATESTLMMNRADEIIKQYMQIVDGADLLNVRETDNAGVLLLVPHFGNWELLSLYINSRKRLHALYEAPKNKLAEELLLAMRTNNEACFYPANAAGVRGIYRALDAGELVGLLPDQVPQRNAGEYVSFFGVPALTMRLAARLIQRSGARVVFAHALRLPQSRGFAISFIDAAREVYSPQAGDCLQAISSHIEQIVSLHPEQYQWEYKRFKRPRTGGDIYKA